MNAKSTQELTQEAQALRNRLNCISVRLRLIAALMAGL